MAKKRTCRFATAIVFLVLGLALIFLALFLLPVIRDDYKNKKVRSNVVMEEGSEEFKEWKDPTAPVYYLFTVFNVTNAEDVVNGTAKPNVSEKGPYYYRETKVKSEIWFNEDSTVMEYKMNTSYEFDRNQTASDLDPNSDKITNLNIPFMAVVEQCIRGELSILEQIVLMIKARGPEVFKTLSVTEMLFGYEDDLTTTLYEADKLLSAKFALFPNDSQLDWDTFSSIRTGTDDLEVVGQFVTWRGMHTLPYWNGTDANMINGTDGTLAHPYLNKDEDVIMFVDNLFRSMNLTYKEDVNLYSVSLFRYVIPNASLQNETTNPQNAQWYANWHWGLLNISKPNMGAPVFASKPRFLDGDPQLRANLTGMKEPDREMDDTYLDFEPLTGFTFRAHKRLQVNVRLQYYKSPELQDRFDNVRDTLMPIVYIDETAEASKSSCDKFVNEVYRPITIVDDTRWGIVALGGVMTLVSGLLLLWWTVRLRKSQREMKLLSSDQPAVQDF